jgi:transposase
MRALWRQLLLNLEPMPEGLPMIMDKAYEDDETRLLEMGMSLVPPKSTVSIRGSYNRELYKKRNEIERLFRRLKGFHRIFPDSKSST